MSNSKGGVLVTGAVFATSIVVHGQSFHADTWVTKERNRGLESLELFDNFLLISANGKKAIIPLANVKVMTLE